MINFLPIGRNGSSIVAFQLIEWDEIDAVVVYDNGDVVLINHATADSRLLHKLAFPFKEEELQIHSYRNYICIVQKHGLLGVVLDLVNAEFKKELVRDEYLPEQCIFSIGFYQKDGQTFLIHATEWNRLDITCLNTGHLLTDRIVDYETEQNYFDYFHSSILVSPDASKFTSNGWIWHPWDLITVYETEKFLDTFESAHIDVEIGAIGERGGYNWDRPLCWIDNNILGIGHNDGEKSEGGQKFSSKILIYDIVSKSITNTIDFDGFEVADSGEATGSLFFDSKNKRFICLNRKTGLLVADEDGRVIHRNVHVTSSRYSPHHNVLFNLDLESESLVLNELIS